VSVLALIAPPERVTLAAVATARLARIPPRVEVFAVLAAYLAVAITVNITLATAQAPAQFISIFIFALCTLIFTGAFFAT